MEHQSDLSNSSDRDRAIALYNQALAHFRTGDPMRIHCLLNAGSSTKSRYIDTRRCEDLLEVLAPYEEAERASDLDTNGPISLFTGLSSAMLLRFRDIRYPTTVECDRLLAMGDGDHGNLSILILTADVHALR